MKEPWELPEKEIVRQAGRAPREVITEEKGDESMAKPKLVKKAGRRKGKEIDVEITSIGGRNPSGKKRGVQDTLPGTEEGLPKMSAALKRLLKPVDEAIHEAATWKQSENDYKATILDLMAEEQLSEVMLPSGGKLRRKAGHPSLTYVPAKKGGVSGGDSGEDENDEGEGSDDEE